MDKNVWLIGAGYMAKEYAKVLMNQNIEFTVIGRGEESAKKFKEEIGIDIIKGGINKAVNILNDKPDFAIVSVNVEDLKMVAILLIQTGIKNILIEKPAGLSLNDLSEINNVSDKYKTNVYVAYNRRFYSSVINAKKIIYEDDGVKSFNFEFTEWSHVIENEPSIEKVKQKWLIANSSHVIDMAFFLGGNPKELSCYHYGKLKWHSSSSIFCGAGITENNALFSYCANWDAPGRWSVEILTRNYRLIFRPLEKLQIQKRESVKIEFIEIDDNLDIKFKPGLFLQVDNFLKKNFNDFCSINQQLNNVALYNNIAGYKDN